MFQCDVLRQLPWTAKTESRRGIAKRGGFKGRFPGARKARLAAERLSFRVFGTLSILDAAALRGFVDLPAALEKLKHTNFRAKPGLLESLLKRYGG